MTHSYLDFSTFQAAIVDQTFEEDDDTDYDALNSETFGEDLPATDWEEAHEQLASELEKRNSFDDDNNELSERIANFLFKDEGEDVDPNPSSSQSQPSHNHQTVAPPPGPLKWWLNGSHPSTVEQPNKTQTPMEAWWQKPQTIPFAAVEAVQMPPKPAQILTVEELEEKMRQEAAAALGARPVPRLAPLAEDVERDMQRIPNHQMQNGNYGRGRGAMISRGRYRPDIVQEQPYHAVHHPYPPYPGAASMIRPPLRHPGPMYPRYYDGRMMHQQVSGPTRHPRPTNHHNQFFPNQHPAYGRAGPQLPSDEYAGLMSQQEKQWLASIQMIQLNTHQPFQDDYYFSMYQQRQGSSGRKICGSHNQKREQLPQKPQATYTPLQFENSLGKLQIGSVTAPRKIIDMELVESLDHNAKQNDKKSKQILLEIEEMYNLVILIEDAFNPLNSIKQDLDIVAIQEKLLNMLTPEGKLVQIMSIRKGKKLVLRMLPNLLFSAKLLHRLMMDLVPITRKDTEHNMLLFLPAIRNYLQTVSLNTLVEITNNYDNQFLLSNKFTVSVMANLIERADQVRADCTDEGVLNEWNLYLIRLLESTRLWNQTERPVVAVDRNVLIHHFTPVMDQVSATEANALLLTLQPATLASTTSTATSSELPKI